MHTTRLRKRSRAWRFVWGFVLGLALVAVWFLAGCAAGKAYERGADGKMQERLVFGVDAGKLAEGASATLGSLTDPGLLAALGGVGVPVLGTLGYLFGKREQAKAGRMADSAYDEGQARALLAKKE